MSPSGNSPITNLRPLATGKFDEGIIQKRKREREIPSFDLFIGSFQESVIGSMVPKTRYFEKKVKKCVT